MVRNFVPNLSRIFGSFAGWLMLVISLLIGYDILLQIIVRHGTIWVYEVTSYGLFWFALMAGGFVLLRDRHIHVELLVQTLNERTQRLLRAANMFLIVIFIGVMFYYTLDLALEALRTKQRSSTFVRVPMFPVYFGGAVGLIVFFLQSIHTFVTDCLGIRKTEGRIQKTPVLLLLAGLVAAALLWTVSPIFSLLVLLCVLLIGGMPVFATLGITGAIGLIAITSTKIGFPQIAQITFKALDHNTLLAVPLFILAGIILQRGNIGQELYQFAAAWVGNIRGGYGVATVLACGIFAAISGSSVAVAATIGIIAIPEMIKRNYRPWKVYGLLAAGGTLGILIPPSTPMILYSGITDESTGQLFMGGVIPGILVMTLFAIWTYFTTEKDTVASRPTMKERLALTKGAIWGVLLPVLILLGIYFGIVTPTQAGAGAVIYALIVSLIRRNVKIRDLPSILAEGTLSSGMILMIIAGALILGQVVTLLKVPDRLLAAINAAGLEVWMVMLIITIGYIILGMFLEVVSILMLTLPVVYPLVVSMGIDGVWFGVFLTMLMELALITPPVGLNLFVIKDVANTDVATVVKGTWVYVVLMAVVIILITIFPQLVLWLPSQLYR